MCKVCFWFHLYTFRMNCLENDDLRLHRVNIGIYYI